MERKIMSDSYSVRKIHDTSDNRKNAVMQLINEKRDAEQLLSSIAPNFLGVYVLDRETDSFRDIIGPNYFRDIVKDKNGKYADAIRFYRDVYVAEDCKGIIDYVLDYDKVYRRLYTGETLQFSYHRKDGGCIKLQIKPYSDLKEEENLSLWIFTEETLDDRQKEYERQKELADALIIAKNSDEELQEIAQTSEIQCEIIMAIGKLYQYISRIDLEADYYEEITALEELHTPEENRTGRPSVNAQRMCEERVAPKYKEAFLQFTDMSTIAERLHYKESIEFEYRINNGKWKRMAFIVKKRNDEGCVTHILCVIRNITELKKKEHDLELNVEQARRDAAEKSSFLSNMSHDIRTPMNGIIGMVDLAERNPSDLETQTYCLNKIKETSKYLLSIVNDVLDMNKLESCDEETLPISFDLDYMFKLGAEAFAKKAAEKNIEYVFDVSKSSYEHRYLSGNPIYTNRILEIVVDNAIKFSGNGGRVELWCREEKIDDKHVIFEFGCKDYGIGMSDEYIGHAFDMFSQENATSRTQYEGTGLGLALAKKMMERLNGTIEIHSKKNVGTTVVMRIPFEICDPDEMGESVDSESISVKGLRVLAAEDNELNMEIAKFILEDNGMHVECAYDGVEAVRMFEGSATGYYDVILMDIMMPHMNGWNAAKKIRSLDREDAEIVPIIAMSANAFADDVIKSRTSGIDRHMAKPLDNDRMIRTIKKCIAEKRYSLSEYAI